MSIGPSALPMNQVKEISDNASVDYYLFRASLRFHGAPPSGLKPAQREETHKLALREHTLASRVLSSEEARDIVITDKARDASIAELEARYECREDFLADLQRNGLHEHALLRALSRQLKVDAVLDLISSRVAPVSEREAELYYHLNKKRFQQPETRTVGHILITVNDEFPENQAGRAVSRINEILHRIRYAPSSFAELARKHSECPSALRGGRLGRLPRGKLYPALDRSLFSLRLGEFSDIVNSPLGLHILFCEKIHCARILPLKEVLPRIMEKLSEQRRYEYQRSWVASLRCRYYTHDE